jgi:hypothetical protein
VAVNIKVAIVRIRIMIQFLQFSSQQRSLVVA